jgi:hypothetical protein
MPPTITLSAVKIEHDEPKTDLLHGSRIRDELNPHRNLWSIRQDRRLACRKVCSEYPVS